MPTSSQSTSEMEGPLAQDPDCQPSQRSASPQPRKFVYEKLVIFAGLLLLILAYRGLAVSAAIRSPLPDEKAEGQQEITAFNPEDLYVGNFQPSAAQGVQEIVQVTELIHLKQASEPPPSLPPDPRATLVRRIIDVPPPNYTFPTATPTPTSEPELLKKYSLG